MNRSDQLTMFGELPPPEEALDQYFTDEKVARVFVGWTGLSSWVRDNVTILEPSCGEGALVKELVALSPRSRCFNVIGVEIDPVRAEYVRSVLDIHVLTGDFLDADIGSFLASERIDAVVMNPPYSLGRDTDHVLRALTLAPVVFCLVRLNFLTTLRRYREIWTHHRLAAAAMMVRRPEWICPGEWGARTDYCFLRIHRGRDCGMVIDRTDFGSHVLQNVAMEWIEIE